MPVNILRIATRKSPLALWQSMHVAKMLRTAHTDLDIALVPMSTHGDDILDQPLAKVGGKGLFLKELERAMQRGDADCAVHSLKDVPTTPEPGFMIVSILERADHGDAFISAKYDSIEALPAGARVGTSSLRRQSQLRACRPDLELCDLRGNINTRLARMDAGDYEAIILACAGLQRLQFDSRISQRLDPPEWLPAPGQGAIAVECHIQDKKTQALCMILEHAPTRICTDAEFAMNRALGGNCHAPIAAFAQIKEARLYVEGMVGSVASGTLLRAQVTGSVSDAEMLGYEVADLLLNAGAGALLAEL